ncbi:MAG: hypothetical protein Q8O19_07335, partial [Rectinemataceae bacterium]|nr:hypothetical protein [Rectinemataceae bacterium]
EMPREIRARESEEHHGTLDALKEKSKGLIELYGGISGVKEALRERQAFDILAAHFEEDKVKNLKDHTEAKEAYDTLVAKKIRSNVSLETNSPIARGVLERYKDSAQHEEQALKITQENEPLLTRAYELLSYQEGLSKEGHICPLPSTVGYIKSIEKRMISGKPVFLHGATGTGKTSLARYAAKELTGKEAEMVIAHRSFANSRCGLPQGFVAPPTARAWKPLSSTVHLLARCVTVKQSYLMSLRRYLKSKWLLSKGCSEKR